MAEYELYCFAQSGNAYRGALMLNLIGADWEPKWVDFFKGMVQRTPDYRENVNEMGEAPVLVDVKRVEVGMVGVNFAIPVPLSYYTFGGWKRSGFGDLNQHGPDSIRFYTKTKTVTSRWPTGTKEGAEFVIPTMK